MYKQTYLHLLMNAFTVLTIHNWKKMRHKLHVLLSNHNVITEMSSWCLQKHKTQVMVDLPATRPTIGSKGNKVI